MPESNQKSVNNEIKAAAGGAPVEAKKPAPTHEEILTNTNSVVKSRRVQLEKLEKAADAKIASLEARKTEIIDEAKSENHTSLAKLQDKKKEQIDFLQFSKDELIADARRLTDETKVELQKQFAILKKNLYDSKKVAEAEALLAARMKAEDENLQRRINEIEAENVKELDALNKEAESKEKMIQERYAAKLRIAREVYKQIEEAKKQKEEALEKVFSADLSEGVEFSSITRPFSSEAEGEQVIAEEEPVGPKEETQKEKKPAVSNAVRNMAYCAVALFVIYLGLKPVPRVAVKNKPGANIVSTDTVKGTKPAIPLEKTGFTIKPSTSAPAGRPALFSVAKSTAGATIRTAASKPVASVKAAKKKVKMKAKSTPKLTKEAIAHKEEQKTNQRLVRAMNAIEPEIKTFNDSGTILQKSPQRSIKLFCDYIKTNEKQLSTEQRAAVAELLFTIKEAKRLDVLGPQEWNLTDLNGIRRGKLKVKEVKDFAHSLQHAIKEKKDAAKSAVKKKTKGNKKKTTHKLARTAALNGGTKVEPLMKGATSQDTTGPETSASTATKTSSAR